MKVCIRYQNWKSKRKNDSNCQRCRFANASIKLRIPQHYSCSCSHQAIPRTPKKIQSFLIQSFHEKHYMIGSLKYLHVYKTVHITFYLTFPINSSLSNFFQQYIRINNNHFIVKDLGCAKLCKKSDQLNNCLLRWWRLTLLTPSMRLN